eukprot:3549826-Pyramimonas_sp.AAC.1
MTWRARGNLLLVLRFYGVLRKIRGPPSDQAPWPSFVQKRDLAGSVEDVEGPSVAFIFFVSQDLDCLCLFSSEVLCIHDGDVTVSIREMYVLLLLSSAHGSM